MPSPPCRSNPGPVDKGEEALDMSHNHAQEVVQSTVGIIEPLKELGTSYRKANRDP